MVAEMLQKEFLCDIKIYFYLIKFNQNKFIFNKVYFYLIKIYFHLIKINFYSIKYICIISKDSFIQSKQISIQ